MYRTLEAMAKDLVMARLKTVLTETETEDNHETLNCR